MLVDSHLHAVPELAAGVASLPSAGTAFAATQGAWRFLNNPRVTLRALVEPMRDVARARVQTLRSSFVLLLHDWCKLAFSFGKRDSVQLTHETDVGYELMSSLLVSADDGAPLALMEMLLKTGHGVLSTRDVPPDDVAHLEQVLPTMEASRTWSLARSVVHVIDREADSVDHFRQWDAAGHKFLVRADDRRVKCVGESCLLSEIAREMRGKEAFTHVGAAEYQGRKAQLWVVETEVVLDRPAKKNVGDKRFEVPGPPLPLRFVVAEVRDERGKALAQWFLLSNVPREWAPTEQLARAYYWRWRIESFFKLMKSHGQQLEQWQQETGAAIARRLVVAAMACVTVWQLQADDSPAAMEFKDVLVRLSGRQTKRRRPHTAPALLAGLWTLLAMLALLEHYDLEELRRLASLVPYRDTG